MNRVPGRHLTPPIDRHFVLFFKTSTEEAKLEVGGCSTGLAGVKTVIASLHLHAIRKNKFLFMVQSITDSEFLPSLPTDPVNEFFRENNLALK